MDESPDHQSIHPFIGPHSGNLVCSSGDLEFIRIPYVDCITRIAGDGKMTQPIDMKVEVKQ